MYNGIGLTTPRGSGTNGHVQRNWAFLRPGKKDNSRYRSEEDIKKLDVTINRPPNKDILDHDRKRKIEVKCLEFEEILEKQGLSCNEIKAKVDSYRRKLMGQGKLDTPKDEFGRIAVRDSHQIAEAQQKKNAKLREAFNISEYFVEGSSFDSDRKAKEDLAKSLALQKELDTQRDQAAATTAKEKESSKRYALVRTPSMEHDASSGGVGGAADMDNTFKKKKKKRTRENSASPDRKKEKKKKSKKHKKESKPKKSKRLRKRKSSAFDSYAENDNDSFDEDSETENVTELKKIRKKHRKDEKKRRNKQKGLSYSSDKSRSPSPIELKKTRESLKENKSAGYKFRSRSKERSRKPEESQRHRYESSQESSNRRSHNERTNSHSDKNSRGRHNSLRDSFVKGSSRMRDCRDSNATAQNNKYRSNRKSRSHERKKHETTVKRIKKLKRKKSEEYPQRESPSVDKRKRYSRSRSRSRLRSHSLSLTRQSLDRNPNKKTTEIERARSGTPRRKCLDNQRNVKKSRSRSPLGRENLQNKSLTPPPKPLKRLEVKKYDTNSSSNQDKSTCFKDKNLFVKKSRSRTNSTSSSSSHDTETSKSRTPSKREHAERATIYEITTQKLLKEKEKFQSPNRTPTSQKRRSTSTSKSRYALNEKSRSDRPSSASKSEEWVEKSEKREDRKKFSSTTPPPSKVEKKALNPRSSRDSSELSYSPARRNPERYRDILENSKNQKTEKSKIHDKDADRKELIKQSKHNEEQEWDRKEEGIKSERNQAKPVVRLQSQSDEDSDATERNNEKILDEFQESKRERELKELKMLEQLKTGIAAKAKEKIKTIEKMAATTSTGLSSNNDREVSDKYYKRTVRNSLNDFLAANNVAPAVVATCNQTAYSSMSTSPPGAIYPQTFEEIKKEQEQEQEREAALQQTEISNHIEKNKNHNNNNYINKDNKTQANCKNFLLTASGHAMPLSPKSPLRNNIMNKDIDFKHKHERDYRERETNNFNKDRYFDKRQKSSPVFYGSGVVGGGTVSGVGIVGGRRNNNNNNNNSNSNSIMLNINHRHPRLNLMCNSGSVGAHLRHPHSHLHPHPHHHYLNHKIINNHHNSTSSCTANYVANNSSTNPHTLICNHANNSTNISFNRPSRINNTPLITATQFNNQMLSKQSNSILVNRRDHRTALNLGLSGTPCTNFSNSNLLLTKANTNSHHIHAAAVGHVVSGGHHHHHHHHHHGQNAGISSGGSNSAAQITDRILLAASIAAAQRHSLSVVHSAASSVAAVAAANNLSYLQQQNKPKLVIKPFKINDSQPLVAALADSSLVDAIVSKVSTATVAAAESAARRSRSRSRRSRSRNRHDEKSSSGGINSSVGLDGNRRRSTSHSRSSRSSTSSRSRSRSHSHRSSRSRSTQYSSSSHTSSRSSSSSCGSSRSGTRSPSIPRRRGSPSFLDRRRITSARKRPIPYHRKLPSDVSSCYCSSCCSRDSSTRSRSPSRDSRSPSKFF